MTPCLSPLAQDYGPAHSLSLHDASDALAAALVHDVGHGPLSHLFEEVFPGAPAHETQRIREHLEVRFPHLEVEFHDGGQPLYPYLVGVE